MSKNGNKAEKPVRAERKATFAGALIAFLLCVAVIMGGIVGLGLDAQTALVGAIIVMMVFGVCFLHIKFQDMVQAMVRSLNDSLECILILLVIGMLIASWMACGTVPYIIYLGLGLLNPSWYLPFIVIMCAVLSSITGSSWTTIGTIGVAFIGISMGMGLPVPLTAGAIVCGAYFGDKCSPVSDIVVFNSGITKQNVYKHAKNVLWTTVPRSGCLPGHLHRPRHPLFRHRHESGGNRCDPQRSRRELSLQPRAVDPVHRACCEHRAEGSRAGFPDVRLHRRSDCGSDLPG